MSEIDVHAKLTAEDDASPVILNLLKNMKKMEAFAKRFDASNLAGRLTGSSSVANRSSVSASAELRSRLTFQKGMARQKAAEQRQSSREAATAFRQKLTFQNRIARQRVAEAARENAVRYRQLQEAMRFQARMTRQRQAEAREVERADARRETAHRREMGRIERESRARRRAFAATGRNAVGGMRDASAGVARAASVTAGAGAAAGYGILRSEAGTDAAEKNAMIYGGLTAIDARALRNNWAGPVGVQLGASTAKMITGYVDALKAGIPENAARDVTALGVQVAEAWDLSVDEVNAVLGNVKAIMTSDGSAFDFGKMRGWANTVQLLAGKLSTTPQALLEYQRNAAGGASILGMTQQASLAFGAASTTLGNRPSESGTMLDYVAGRVAAMPQLARQDGLEGNRARKLLKTLGFGSAAGLEKARKSDPDNFIFDLLERLHKVRDPRQRNEALLAFAGQEWLGELGRMVTGINTVREARTIQRSANGIDAIGAAWEIHTKKLAFAGRQALAGLGLIVGEMGKVLGPLAIDAARFFTSWAGTNSKKLGVAFWAATTGLVEGLLGREGTFRDLLEAVFGKGALGSNPSGTYAFAKGIGSAVRDLVNGIRWLIGVAKSFLDTLGGGDPEKTGKALANIVGGSVAANALSGPLSFLGTGAGAAVGAAVGAGGAGLLGAAALPVAIVAAGATLAVAIMNWDSLREIWTGLFGRPGWTDRREENDAARARGEGKDYIDGFLDRWFGPAFGRRQDPISGGGGSPSLTGGSIGRDRLSGADLGQAVMPTGGVGGGGGNRAMLDAISRAEGTFNRPGGGYSTSLGYGRFLPGGREQDLTSKSLAEVYQLGLHMRRQPGNPNSSALGRYQVTGSTMRDAASALGMDWNTTRFDTDTQDRMAAWIWKTQGARAWAGFRHNPGELSIAKEAAAGAPTITSSSITGSAIGAGVQANNVRMANGGGIRNKHITDSLRANLSEAVMNAYGPGFTAEVYSGGQDRKGHGHRRTGSTRHDDGRAADVYIVGPDGKRLRGDMLGPIAQEWLAKQRGGVGLEMNGGGIHLDEHKDRAKTWTYGALTPGQRQAVAKGMAGQVPPSMKPTASELSSKVPSTGVSGGGLGGMAPTGGAGGGGSSPNISIHINGANQSPETIAKAVESRLAERRMWTTGDVEYDV